jgi:DNA (cytosine-5)-methyltransferase 1
VSLTHGSLFSGIGGFDLGFERAGIRTVWQVEIDAYARRVLARHFPNATRFADIRDICGRQEPHERHDCGHLYCVPWVDVLSGGFPCQDISNAGKRAGIDGERSGLWSEYARIIRELRPRYVVVENVAALLGRGMERVLGDLAACVYDAEWQSIRASDVGAPHRRERIWIVAYPRSEQHQSDSPSIFGTLTENLFADANGRREQSGGAQRDERRFQNETLRDFRHCHDWAVEPDVGRVAHGVPARVDRLRGLGNAIVPQIAELIGKRVAAHASSTQGRKILASENKAKEETALIDF